MNIYEYQFNDECIFYKSMKIQPSVQGVRIKTIKKLLDICLYIIKTKNLYHIFKNSFYFLEKFCR